MRSSLEAGNPVARLGFFTHTHRSIGLSFNGVTKSAYQVPLLNEPVTAIRISKGVGCVKQVTGSGQDMKRHEP